MHIATSLARRIHAAAKLSWFHEYVGQATPVRHHKHWCSPVQRSALPDNFRGSRIRRTGEADRAIAIAMQSGAVGLCPSPGKYPGFAFHQKSVSPEFYQSRPPIASLRRICFTSLWLNQRGEVSVCAMIACLTLPLKVHLLLLTERTCMMPGSRHH